MSKPYNRKDHFYKRAKDEGYRSRAAYKLEELDKRYKLMKRGSTVIDLGCYPGGWLQVALAKVTAKGKVLGVDLVDVSPVSYEDARAEIIKGDFTDPQIREQLLAFGPYDVVLSDMSPKLTGVRIRDAVRSAELVEAALDFADQALRPHGSFVAKIFPSEECEALAKRCKARFRTFARPNLDSSRKSSNELYFVGKGRKVQERE